MISSIVKRSLPSGGSNGQYLTISEAGLPSWKALTPGGIVTEAGANAANTIGEGEGTTVAEKVWNLILSIAYRLDYINNLEGGYADSMYDSVVEGGGPGPAGAELIDGGLYNA